MALDAIVTLVLTFLILEKLFSVYDNWYDNHYDMTIIVFVSLYFAFQIVVAIIESYKVLNAMNIMRTLFLRIPSIILDVYLHMLMISKDKKLH